MFHRFNMRRCSILLVLLTVSVSYASFASGQTSSKIAEEVGRTIGSAIAKGMSSSASHQPAITSQGQKVWLAHIQLLKNGESARKDRLQKAIADIDSCIARLYKGSDYSSFAKNVLGFGSKLKMLNGQSLFRGHLDAEFRKHVLNVADLETYMQRRTKDLSNEMAQISDALLVGMKADTEVNFQLLKVPALEVPQLKGQLQSVVDVAQKKAYESVQASIVSFGIGTVAGNTVQKMFTPAQDPNADAFTTMFNKAVGGALNIAAGLAVDQVVSEVYNTEGKLIDAVHTSVQNNLLPLMSSGSRGTVWIGPLKDHVVRHRSAFMDASCKALKIDRVWAEQSLTK